MNHYIRSQLQQALSDLNSELDRIVSDTQDAADQVYREMGGTFEELVDEAYEEGYSEGENVHGE